MCSIEARKGVAVSAVQPGLRKKHPIRIEGHRGAGHMEPENSIKAFERAIDLGIDGVEFDVWLTKDNVPVVVHGLPGGIVEFEGDVKEAIGEIDYETLKTKTLKDGEKISTLAEVLDTCKDKIHLNIELKDRKDEVIDGVLTLLQERDMFEQITFSSFDHDQREKIASKVTEKKITAEVTFGFLLHIDKIMIPDSSATQYGDSINVDIRYLMRKREECILEINKAQKRGLKVKFWFPMDYQDEHLFYGDLMDLQIDTIITNKPLTIIEYFENL